MNSCGSKISRERPARGGAGCRQKNQQSEGNPVHQGIIASAAGLSAVTMSKPLLIDYTGMTSMTFSTRIRLMLLVSAIVTAASFAGAQQPAIPANVLDAPLGQTVPVDPLIT